MEASKITVYEIAKKARVSIATVSRALNPRTKSKVAPDTQALIEQWAQKLRYTPSLAAKHLSRSKYDTIGVVFPHHAGILQSDYYSQIISGVADCLLNSNYKLEMVLLKPNENGWDHYDFQHGEGLDGLIMTYWHTFFKESRTFRKLNIPSVIINNVETNIHARFVAADHFQGGKLAAECLYEHGHRKIVVMTGNYGAPDVQERLKGFRSFLRSKHITLDEHSILDVNFERQRAYEMTEWLVTKRPEVTAVFCTNDTQAHGVLDKLKEMNITCPKRISVIGYDDDSVSQYSHPPLTTVHVPVYTLAKAAAQDLIQYLKDPQSMDFYTPKRFPVTLVERGSVRKL